MEHYLNQLEELVEMRINDLSAKNRDKQARSLLEQQIRRMDKIMRQLSEDDREWLDSQLIDIGCSKEEDDKIIYKAGFCDSLKIIKLLGI